MKLKRSLALLLALVMMVSLFTACGDGGKKEDPSKSPENTESGEPSESPEDSPSESPEETPSESPEETPSESPEETPEVTTGIDLSVRNDFAGEIFVNTGAGTGAAEGWQAAADAYMAMNPDVKVTVDLKPGDGYAEWIQNMFATNDTTSSDICNINMAGPAASGKNINFMEYATDIVRYSGLPWNEQFNFDVQGKDLAKGEWSNISLDSVQVLWVYNKNIFAEVGVEPPKSWNEFVDVAAKIDAAGYQALSVAGDFNSFWAGAMGWIAQVYMDQTTRSMINVYRAQPGDYNYDPDLDGVWEYDPTNPWNDDAVMLNQNPVRAYKAVKDGTYDPSSPGMLTVWENFAKMFPKYAGGDAFFGTGDALPMFYQGKAAILLDGAWRLPSFKRDMDKLTAGEDITSGDVAIEGVQKFEIGTFNMPSMEGTGIEAPARTLEVAVGFFGAVKKDKAHDDMVVDFLKYFSSADGYTKYLGAMIEGGGTPNGPSFVYGVEIPADYAAMFDNLEFIGNCQKGYGQMMARGIGDIQESLRAWYGYTQELLTGKITVDEWGTQNRANIMKYLPDSMAASKISDADLENPQNQPTGQ